MYSDEEFDIRLIYIACAYILTHRGHFLIEVDKNNIDAVKNIDFVFEGFMNWFDSMEIERPFECSASEFGNILKEKRGILNKEKAFKDLLWNGKKPDDEEYYIKKLLLIKLISGGKVKLSELFKNDNYAELENNSICLATADFDTILEQLKTEMEDGDADLIEAVKAVYDWSLLNEILSGKDSISEAKIAVYEKHRYDLRILKDIADKYIRKDYDIIFKVADTKLNNYVCYSGNIKNSKMTKMTKFSKCSQEDFCKFVTKFVKDIKPLEEDFEKYEYLMTELKNYTLCPKQVTTDNRVIPYQLYYYELKKILDNCEKYIPLLSEKDEYGSVKDKILSLMIFRIPYYVGPLVDESKSANAWMVRKEKGCILPWNFNEKVNLDESENAFIRKMTCKCTYIAGENVLPKNSLLYSKFTVLNEINNIKINGMAIACEDKQGIYNNLFLKKRRVTKKDIEKYLIANGKMELGDKLEGLDITVKSALKSYHDFKGLIENGVLNEAQVEKIIERITMTTDRKRLRNWLAVNFNNLSREDAVYISKLNYNDFGRLSSRFLTEIKDIDISNGEVINPSIINMLWETNNNLMELLSNKYHYMEYIEELNRAYYVENPVSLEERLNNMYISNAVKRPIIRTLEVVKEIKKIMGYAPDKIFVEMARDVDESNKGKRTDSRRDKISKYFSMFDDEEVRELRKELELKSDDELRGEKLYLYFLQLGRCMYSGKEINIEQLGSKEYDIDHIYPQSKIKDDSIDNKVLVLSELNGKKRDDYPISPEIQKKMYNMWSVLHNKGLISDKKFNRLVRNTDFTDEELAGFISRQIVETRQSTKAIATLLKEIMPDTEIVYVKAGLVSEFRHQYKLLKCREINDLHHAKDAYLNIVMGNVYNVKFTKNPLNYIKNEYKNNAKNKYSMKLESLLSYDIERNGVVAWKKDNSSINTVKKFMAKNNIHYVRYAYRRKGALYNVNPEKANAELVNRKANLPAEKYGGYNNTVATCFVLTKYFSGNKSGIVFMPLEIMYAEDFYKNSDFAMEYTLKNLSEIVTLKKGNKIDKVEFPLGKRLIKINTMLDIDGYRANIIQKSNKGKTLVFAQGIPLITHSEKYEYIRKLSAFNEKLINGKRTVISEEYDKITVDANIELYDYLAEKILTRPYCVMFSKVGEKIKAGRDEFVSCSLDEQLKVLLNMVSIMKSGRSVGCDLRLIGGVEKAAIITLNSEITKVKNIKSVRIVDQSSTGIFEKYSKNLLRL